MTPRVMERSLRDRYHVVAAVDVDGAFAPAREYDLDLLLLDLALNDRRTGVLEFIQEESASVKSFAQTTERS